MKSKNFLVNPKIAKQEVITDQSDPRMIKFRKEQGEFEPGYHQGNTVRLQITEYEAGPDEYHVMETIRFVSGVPSLFEIPLFREMAEKAILKVNEEHQRERWAKELHISFRDYRRRDRKAVLELWRLCKLTQPWEEPAKHINQRTRVHPDLFLVCWSDDRIIATVMGRCDENWGWVEYLAVHPSFRKKGIGRQLVKIMEDRLHKKGCSEISILIDPDKAAAIEFSRRAGYGTKNVTLMKKEFGRRLIIEVRCLFPEKPIVELRPAEVVSSQIEVWKASSGCRARIRTGVGEFTGDT